MASEAIGGMKNATPTQGKSSGSRQKASDAFRTSAQLLRLRADDLDQIADALDRCVPRGTDGSDSHEYIGVGSSAEQALWQLALNIR